MKHYESHEHASALKYLCMEKKNVLFTQGYKSVNFRCLFLIGKELRFSNSITQLGYSGNYADLFSVK